ncbi:MAG: SHOCT domain-containing protein [Desulfobacteraceae bacterium]|nr:SHOCT domain-containing protein [Desulfobacteraceae bacterium]
MNKDSGFIVKLQQKMKDGRPVAQDYSHPAEIGAESLAWFFNDLSYMTSPKLLSDSEEKPVFQNREINRLAPAVSRALKNADAAQRVHFTSYNYSRGLLFQKRRITQGTLFVDAKGNLNMDFSWINQEVNLEDQPKGKGEFNQGGTIGMAESDTPVLANRPYIRHHRGENGKADSMWIQSPVQDIRRVAESVKPAQKKQAKEPAGEATPLQKPDQSQSGVEKTPEADKPEPKAPAGDWETRKAEIRDRLEYLKELYQEGLITESEYQEQKQQILKELK